MMNCRICWCDCAKLAVGKSSQENRRKRHLKTGKQKIHLSSDSDVKALFRVVYHSWVGQDSYENPRALKVAVTLQIPRWDHQTPCLKWARILRVNVQKELEGSIHKLCHTLSSKLQKSPRTVGQTLSDVKTDHKNHQNPIEIKCSGGIFPDLSSFSIQLYSLIG